MDLNEFIGRRIREERKKQGLTMAELGSKMGISGSLVGRYERGEERPKAETMKRFADALNISWIDLYPVEQRAAVMTEDINNSLKSGAKFQKIGFEEAVKAGFVTLTFKNDNDRAVYYMTKLNECGQDVAVQTALAIFDQRLNGDKVLKFRFLLKLFGDNSMKEIADKVESLAQVEAYQKPAEPAPDKK